VHKSGDGVGSLLLGLHDDVGTLHHVGVATSFTAKRRAELTDEVAPYAEGALDDHPWQEWAEAAVGASSGDGQRMPGGQSRWNAGKDVSWVPLRAELVAEVAYDHLQGDPAGRSGHAARFRHATHLVRWRPDRDPSSCTYEQTIEVPAVELHEVFGS
jgi:ATP-dependent DNA ligase